MWVVSLNVFLHFYARKCVLYIYTNLIKLITLVLWFHKADDLIMYTNWIGVRLITFHTYEAWVKRLKRNYYYEVHNIGNRRLFCSWDDKTRKSPLWLYRVWYFCSNIPIYLMGLSYRLKYSVPVYTRIAISRTDLLFKYLISRDY